MANTLDQRFWSKVRVGDPDDCWEWSACRTSQGYGRIGVLKDGVNDVMTPGYAHRVSWELHYGPVPEGLCVLHRCDNPPCVNPNHLFLGAHVDNTADMFAKGRNVTPGHSPRVVTDATRQRMREAKLGGKHWRAKPVTVDGKEYDCHATAARALGVCSSTIRVWLRTGRATYGSHLPRV